MSSSRDRLRANLLLLAVIVVWGATFVIVKDALADASATLFNFLRMTLACAILLAVYRPRFRAVERRQWVGGVAVGALLAAGYQFQTIGLKFTTASKSAFITGAVVVMVPLLSGLLLLAKRWRGSVIRDDDFFPGPRAFLGAALAFAGLAVLTLPPGPSLAAMLREINPGDALTFGCAIAFALHILVMARVARFTNFRLLAILQSGFAAIFLAVCLPVSGRPYLHWTPRLVFALAITAVLATAVAFAVQSYAQSILPPTNIALLMTLEPVFAWITSYLVLGERLGVRGGLGALMVIAGILVTELRFSAPWSPESSKIRSQ